jgi:hypothetical protein
LGIEMCCVNGGLFKVNMSVGHRQVYTMSNNMISFSLVLTSQTRCVCRDDQLTLVVPLDALFQPVRGLSETISIHLGVYEL